MITVGKKSNRISNGQDFLYLANTQNQVTLNHEDGEEDTVNKAGRHYFFFDTGNINIAVPSGIEYGNVKEISKESFINNKHFYTCRENIDKNGGLCFKCVTRCYECVDCVGCKDCQNCVDCQAACFNCVECDGRCQTCVSCTNCVGKCNRCVDCTTCYSGTGGGCSDSPNPGNCSPCNSCQTCQGCDGGCNRCVGCDLSR